MQPVSPAVPELDVARDDAEAAPEGRHGNAPFSKLSPGFHPFHFQKGARGHDLALRRSPRAELAAKRPGQEIRQSFACRHAFGQAADRHLPVQWQPGKEERHIWVLGNLTRLAAFQVRVKNKAALIKLFEQDRSRRRPPIRSHRRQGHRIRLDEFRLARLFHPSREQLERVGAQIFLTQFSEIVMNPEAFQFHGQALESLSETSRR